MEGIIAYVFSINLLSTFFSLLSYIVFAFFGPHWGSPEHSHWSASTAAVHLPTRLRAASAQLIRQCSSLIFPISRHLWKALMPLIFFYCGGHIDLFIIVTESSICPDHHLEMRSSFTS